MATVETDRVARARWTDLATLGFAMVAAGAVIGLLAIVAFGLPFSDFGPFLIVVGVVPGLTILLMRRFGTWAKVLGAVIAVLAVLMMVWSVFGITRPNSFVDFMFAVLIPPGAIIALVGCISAIVAKRRGHLSPRPEGAEARAIRTVLTAIAVLAAMSLVLTLATRSTASRSAAAASVEMKNSKFQAAGVSAAAGSKVYVHNSDPFAHTFTVDALEIDVSFGPGSSKLITIPAKSGSYILYCTFHTSNKEHPSRDDMTGTLTVT